MSKTEELSQQIYNQKLAVITYNFKQSSQSKTIYLQKKGIYIQKNYEHLMSLLFGFAPLKFEIVWAIAIPDLSFSLHFF